MQNIKFIRDTPPPNTFVRMSQINKPTKRQIILFYDDEGRSPETFADGIDIYSYRIEVISDGIELAKRATQTEISGIIIRSHSGNKRILKLIATFSHLRGGPPILFISDSDDMVSRIQALRAGANAYLLAPCSELDIIDRLDMMKVTDSNPKNSEEASPFKVLILGDNTESLNYYESVLVEEKIEVKRVTDWTDTLEKLAEIVPDAIIIDQDFNNCDAGELAKIIRMDPIYDPIPIIFLSADTHFSERHNLIGCGGDEFLIKPISPRQLVLTVEAKAKRFRRIRTGITRDSLTGLFDHKNLRLGLESEMERAKRTKSELCYCMIDIDDFKLVNDTYGHARGDQVLKSLSHLLRRRLRKSDIIGRYGGEEFGIVLPGATSQNATIVMNNIRESFAELPFYFGDIEFKVTFSGGIASLASYNSVQDLTEAADQSLFRAKAKGKNRISVAL